MASSGDNKVSSIMYPVAYATFFQGACFLGAALLRGRVPFIPKDPLVLIGSVYTLAGLDLVFYGYYKDKKSDKKDS